MYAKRIFGVVYAFFIYWVVLDAQPVKHESYFSFEEPDVPAVFSVGQSVVSVSDRHFKDGKQSLRWDFEQKGTLSLKKDLLFEPKDPTGKDTYLSVFIIWIYNEKALDTTIRFEFLKDGKVCTSFPFGINFTGWRAAWVCYERDMEGIPEVGMNELRITAPDRAGTLYIDHLITASKVDARQQTADCQVPFVNKETTNHWLVIYKHSLLKPDLPLVSITDKDIKEMQLVEKRFRDMIYTPGNLTGKEIMDIRKKYDTYGISYKEGIVTGKPIFMVRAAEAYERMIPDWDKDMFVTLGMEMRAYFDLMKQIAVAYNDASEKEIREEMRRKFMAMYDHITDQVVAYGSCWGNIHHYGYSVRGLYLSYFLMKDVLREEGKLNEAERTLRWYAITNEVYPRPLVNGIDMDSFNTQTTGRIASILIMEDTPEKLQYLKSFSRWIDYGCRPALGLTGSFKTDGAAFHHCNNYPAYAVGGLDGATNMIYLLNHTSFAVSELAHRTVKDVLLAMRFYCNTKQFPLSMSGRHPNGIGKLIPIQYATMAMAGTPDGKEVIDKDMAAAYLRLVTIPEGTDKDAPDYLPPVSSQEEERMKLLLEKEGYKPERNPEGNLALGYGCVSVQRRDNWAAVVRGHSRYLWAAEHYLDANFYGRYLAHGSMQILTGKPDEMVTFTTSGWQENGFDWNRIPGATSIHLTFDQLRATVLNVDKYSGMEEMLYSDEAFAGGLSQIDRNGNFGMKLHEHDKYNGTHRARLSYHFFDDVIVCLGSDIENENTVYPTETTLFQLAATTPEYKAYWDNYDSNGKYYIDPNGVGYCLPSRPFLATQSEVKFEKQFPQITVGERNPKPTSGDWVSLTFQHGKAPKGASYEYAVLPGSDSQELEKFSKKPAYRVLKQDKEAHIVCTADGKTISYILFDNMSGNNVLPEGLLLAADTSCLVMIHEEKKELLLTVAQPDLALYRGESDDIYGADGKRIERSIYSRPWIGNDSGEITVTLTLKGKWEMTPTATCRILSSDKKHTVIQFVCRDGASQDLLLRK